MKNKAIALAAMANAMEEGMNQIVFSGQAPNPIFIPRKHTKQTYRSQQRNALKRRRAK